MQNRHIIKSSNRDWDYTQLSQMTIKRYTKEEAELDIRGFKIATAIISIVTGLASVVSFILLVLTGFSLLTMFSLGFTTVLAFLCAIFNIIVKSQIKAAGCNNYYIEGTIVNVRRRYDFYKMDLIDKVNGYVYRGFDYYDRYAVDRETRTIWRDGDYFRIIFPMRQVETILGN